MSESSMSGRRALTLALVCAWSIVLATGCSDSPTGPEADVTAPAVPQQVSPATGTLFTHFPRTTTLVWNPVTDPSGPVTYRVEAQFCQSQNPTACSTGPTWCAGVLSDISCSFSFVGGQPGRWRVKAVDAAGNESAFSDWWVFEFDS